MDGLTGVTHPPLSLSRSVWCPCAVLLLQRARTKVTKRHQTSMPTSILWSLVRKKKVDSNPSSWKKGSTIFPLFLLFSSTCRVSYFTSHSQPARFAAALVSVSSVTSQWLYSPRRLRSAAACSQAAFSGPWCPPPAPWWSEERAQGWMEREVKRRKREMTITQIRFIFPASGTLLRDIKRKEKKNTKKSTNSKITNKISASCISSLNVFFGFFASSQSYFHIFG